MQSNVMGPWRWNWSLCTFTSLENLFLLTMRKKNELRVDMEDWEGGREGVRSVLLLLHRLRGRIGYQLHWRSGR
ncbi:hypothetical protein VZT92_003119 [Zoarces viviparus]|uniref:Uncharacterized protein n=1 Tax=Zoarces viviparus TaxID=48416 RepID=A0AAW1G0J5_ZOAVI